MPLQTTLEQLEEVQAAITAVMSGQSYKIGDISFTRANLKDLMDRETALMERYNLQQRGGRRFRPNFQDGV